MPLRAIKLTRGNATPRSLAITLDTLGVTEGEEFEVGLSDGAEVKVRAGEMLCEDCDSPVDPTRAWTQVVGWEKMRAGGGTNHVALRQPLGSVLCNDCMTNRKRGISPEQESIPEPE